MSDKLFSRRDFSRSAFQAFAAALALRGGTQSATVQRHATPVPEGAIRINFNENNYGPSPKALAALDVCGNIANRYPFRSEIDMNSALAAKFGVKPENVVLGCGSTEVLRVVDAAFLTPGSWRTSSSTRR